MPIIFLPGIYMKGIIYLFRRETAEGNWEFGSVVIPTTTEFLD